MRGLRRPSRLAALLLGAFALVHASSARAANDCGAPLASTCINDDNLWPHAGPSHFLTVGGTETTSRDDIGFGLYTSYLSRPLTLSTNGAGQPATDYAVDNQINATFLFSYGVADRLELGAILPVTLSQSGSGGSAITGAGTGLQTTGIRDFRFGFTYALVPRRRVDPEAHLHGDLPKPSVWSLAARMEVSAPTGDTSGFGSDGYAVWAPSLAADYRRGPWFAGAELGLRLRPTQELDGARIGSQAFVGLGLGRDLLPHEWLSVTAEAYALPTFAEQHALSAPEGTFGLVSSPDGQYIVPAEWMVGVRSAPLFGGDLEIAAGGGGSLPFSDNAPITNPRFRFSLSLRYAPKGRDSDHDGVRDKDDKCPFVHGVPGNPAGDGCPPSAEHEVVDLTAQAPPEPSSPTPLPLPLPSR
jgi:OOP family OmpA-OmpF porin